MQVYRYVCIIIWGLCEGFLSMGRIILFICKQYALLTYFAVLLICTVHTAHLQMDSHTLCHPPLCHPPFAALVCCIYIASNVCESRYIYIDGCWMLAYLFLRTYVHIFIHLLHLTVFSTYSVVCECSVHTSGRCIQI